MDFQSIQTAALSADPGAAQKQTKVFSAKMTLPFDAYSKTLTPEKLQADLAKYSQNLPVLPIPNEHANRNWFLALLVRSLLSVVNLFSRPPNPSFDLAQDFSHIELSCIHSPIEKKVSSLLTAVDQVLALLAPAWGSDACELNQELLRNVTSFRANLFGLLTEIDDSRIELIDFETKVTSAFSDLCIGFSKRITVAIESGTELKIEDQDVMWALVQDLLERLNPKLENEASDDLSGDGPSTSFNRT